MNDRFTSNAGLGEFARAHGHLLTFSPVLIDVNHSKRGAQEVFYKNGPQ